MSAPLSLRPGIGRALVRRLDPPAQTAGGIHLLEDARAPTYLAEVVAAGPFRRLASGELVPPVVQPGERVLLHMLAGARSEIRVPGMAAGETLQFVMQADIHGVVDPGAALSVTLVRA